MEDMALLEIDLASLVDFVESTDADPVVPSGHTDAGLVAMSMVKGSAAEGGAAGLNATDGGVDGLGTDAMDSELAKMGGSTSPPLNKPRRVRKGKELSFADVSRHFDLPLTQAAERLNVCVTLVKRVCRENGVSRWPYRKLQSRKKKERIAREASAAQGGTPGTASLPSATNPPATTEQQQTQQPANMVVVPTPGAAGGSLVRTPWMLNSSTNGWDSMPASCQWPMGSQ